MHRNTYLAFDLHSSTRQVNGRKKPLKNIRTLIEKHIRIRKKSVARRVYSDFGEAIILVIVANL